MDFGLYRQRKDSSIGATYPTAVRTNFWKILPEIAIGYRLHYDGDNSTPCLWRYRLQGSWN